jgi:hypothetical protein
MVSKSIIITLFVILLSYSCKRNEEATNRLFVENATSDTIFLAKNSYGSYFILLPFECCQYAETYQQSISEIISEHFDFIEVYKLACSTCVGKLVYDQYGGKQHYVETIPKVIWSPPLVSLPHENHSFFNINSWVITKGGLDNKWDIATFTITEDDFK